MVGKSFMTEHVRARIFQEIESLEISHREFARRAGLAPSSLRSILAGSDIMLNTLARLARGIGMKPDELVRIDEGEPVHGPKAKHSRRRTL